MTRNTIQRALVLEAVNQLHCHASAEEIYNAVVQTHPSISRGTVYRNLNRLAEAGQIRKIMIPGRAEHFDHLCCEHYHVVCEKCGRIFDVDMDCIPGLEKKIKSDNGFQFTGCDIFFKGICPDCRE